VQFQSFACKNITALWCARVCASRPCASLDNLQSLPAADGSSPGDPSIIYTAANGTVTFLTLADADLPGGGSGNSSQAGPRIQPDSSFACKFPADQQGLQMCPVCDRSGTGRNLTASCVTPAVRLPQMHCRLALRVRPSPYGATTVVVRVFPAGPSPAMCSRNRCILLL
jgi:hypothetical protein